MKNIALFVFLLFMGNNLFGQKYRSDSLLLAFLDSTVLYSQENDEYENFEYSIDYRAENYMTISTKGCFCGSFGICFGEKYIYFGDIMIDSNLKNPKSIDSLFQIIIKNEENSLLVVLNMDFSVAMTYTKLKPKKTTYRFYESRTKIDQDSIEVEYTIYYKNYNKSIEVNIPIAGYYSYKAKKLDHVNLSLGTVQSFDLYKHIQSNKCKEESIGWNFDLSKLRVLYDSIRCL